MDRHDDKWVDLMREKLEGYSPSYNAADWSGLASKMPAAGAGGHGWLLSKLFPYTKIILISSVAVITTVVTLLHFNNRQAAENEQSAMQFKDTLSVVLHNSEMPENTEAVSTMGAAGDKASILSQSDVETGRVKTDPDNERSEVKHVETENSISDSDAGSEKIPDPDVETINQKPEDQSGIQVLQKPVTSQSSKSLVKPDAKNQNAYLNAGKVKSKKNINKKTNRLLLPEEKTGLEVLYKKLKHRSVESNVPVRVNPSLSPSYINAGTSGKQDRLNTAKQYKPLYIGVSYTGTYVNDDLWYPVKFHSLFGVSLEKYIVRNFSVSINTRVSLNSIYKEYPGDVRYDDSVYFAFDDSLGIPVPPDSSGVYPGKLSYIDLPLIFSYDVFSGLKYKLSASLGVTSRYTFSLQKDKLSEEMKNLNNKFHFIQSGYFSLRYNRTVSDKLFFELEPYWQFPLKKGAGFFDKSFYGFNLSLKFRVF